MDRLFHRLSVDGKKRIITLQACSDSDVSGVLCIPKVVLTCCGVSEERQFGVRLL